MYQRHCRRNYSFNVFNTIPDFANIYSPWHSATQMSKNNQTYEQEANEKAEEIDAKAEEEFNIEKG